MLLLSAVMACTSYGYTGYTKCSQRKPFNGVYRGVRKLPVVTYGRGTAAPYGGGPKTIENPYVTPRLPPIRKARRIPSGRSEMVHNPYAETNLIGSGKPLGKSQVITFPNGTRLIVSPAYATGSSLREPYIEDGLKELKTP